MQEYFTKEAAKRYSEQGVYEATLAEKAKQGDKEALKELTERLMPLIEQTARIAGRNSMIPQEILRSEAVNIAQHYIPQYVPTKGASVGTYIRGNVSKKLQTFIQENSRMVRYQGHLLSVVPKVREVVSHLDETLGKGNYDIPDIHDEMVRLHGKSSKWNTKNIERIVKNIQPEQIGGRLYGESGVGQDITLMDAVNVTEPMSHKDLAEELEVNRIFQTARRALDPEEYKLFESYINDKQSENFKMHGLALKFNLSTKDLDNKLKEIRVKLNKEL